MGRSRKCRSALLEGPGACIVGLPLDGAAGPGVDEPLHGDRLRGDVDQPVATTMRASQREIFT